MSGENGNWQRVTGRDFAFTRLCDGHPVGSKLEGSLEVAFLSPLGDNYAEYADDARRDFRNRVPTKAACSSGYRTTAPGPRAPHLPTDRLLRKNTADDHASRNHQAHPSRPARRIERRSRLIESLKTLLARASYFASGQSLDIAGSDPKAALETRSEYLIKNTYSKMDYIQYLHPNPKQEIQSTLRANDVEQVSLALNTPEANAQAMDDLREYVRLCAMRSQTDHPS
ncbi:MAG: hypothetical protein R3F21_18560 [Myxococcota bacterium]